MAYPGGKNGPGVFQTLINLMPPHDLYVEPFLGGAAIMRLKRPAAVNIGIDLAIGPVNAAAYHFHVRPAAVPPARIVRAAQFEFWQEDALAFLERFELPTSALVYCDPPYVGSTRSSDRRIYAHEMTDADHGRLLEILHRLRCRVLISGYSSTLYARRLKDWNAATFQASTRGGPAAEWVWFNYDRPVALHDYRYLGRDFREREQIKRMKARWTARLAAMPILRRQALLAAIAGTVPSDEASS